MGTHLPRVNVKVAKIEIDLLLRTTYISERGVNAELDEIRNSWEEVSPPNDYSDEMYRDHLADEGTIVREAAQFLRLGIVISMYAVLEKLLVRLCEVYDRASAEENDSSGSPNDDFYNYDIHDARTYLKNEVGICFPDMTSEWQEINRVKDLRNVLAHRHGRLSEDEAEGPLGDYIRRRNGLSLDRMFTDGSGPGDAIIEHEYPEALAELLTSFFDDLAGRLPDT